MSDTQAQGESAPSQPHTTTAMVAYATTAAAAAPSIASTDEPRFCPWCGACGTLHETEGSGFIELGCWNGREYCFEGNPPGYACTGCGNSFCLDLDDDAVHEDCRCRDDVANRFCECGRNQPRPSTREATV